MSGSLSFVSSAVLESSDGVSHNEERQIENKETQALRGQKREHIPIFEQLRANQEEEEAKREEFQKSVMRGTLALDEDDCAHLDTISKQRQQKEYTRKQELEHELALFRAAKEERHNQSQLLVDDDNDDDNNNNDQQQQQQQDDNNEENNQKINTITDPIKMDGENNTTTSATLLMPKIVIKKKRRRRQQQDTNNNTDEKKKQKKAADKKISPTTIKDDGSDKESSKEKDEKDNGALGGLLGDYGSSSDDE